MNEYIDKIRTIVCESFADMNLINDDYESLSIELQYLKKIVDEYIEYRDEIQKRDRITKAKEIISNMTDDELLDLLDGRMLY